MVCFSDWFPETSRGSKAEREERERERAPGKKSQLVWDAGLSHTDNLVQPSFQRGEEVFKHLLLPSFDKLSGRLT